MLTRISFATLILAVLVSGCYTLSGISIDPETDTYFVANFKNNAPSALPGLELQLTEALVDKLNRETRLEFRPRSESPDIEMIGTLVDFRITSEAPQPGEVVALNRLTIVIALEYIDNKNKQDKEKNWKSNFSHFVNFDATVDITTIQDDLVEEIKDQLMEDIFNKAFTNW